MKIGIEIKLDPKIRKYSDIIFQSDPEKFKKLIVWILQAQKHHWSDDSIVLTLARFVPYSLRVDDGWWQYLDKLIEKAAKDLSAARHDRQHYRLKLESEQTAKILNLSNADFKI